LTLYLIDNEYYVRNEEAQTARWRLAWLKSLELGQGFFSSGYLGEIQKGIELTRLQNLSKQPRLEAWALELEQTSKVLP